MSSRDDALGADPLGGECFLAGQADVPGQSQHLHGADDQPADVQLPPAEPVAGRGGKGVVRVVPAFTEGQNSEHKVVPAHVVGRERSSAPKVARRVYAPCDMVYQQHANQPAPNHPGPDARPTLRDDPAKNARQYQPQGHPHREQVAHPTQCGTGQDVGNVCC